MNSKIIEKTTSFCIEIFADKKNYILPDEFNYSHLPLCVIDSVFSIGVKYEIVQNTINRFCAHNKIDKFSKSAELSTSFFLNLMEQKSITELTESIYKNRQRTSTRSGILKSEAVIKFLKILQKHEVNKLSDLYKIISSKEFEIDIKQIPGQKSGISLTYFFMLAGSDDLIKPDRMIIRFLESISEENVSLSDCQIILAEVAKKLQKNGFDITPKKLDNLIWNYQRNLN
ncbi:hypothetical protein [Flavobacterium frigoris]|uniref:Uncharacterized protein n=1 Tax=Flavobacterium frigoris TaxID=229204 RepID=A0A1H9KSV1_FLAFI|nr:hypothetical protein [Flavobacterium frigoris]SER02202.1 hypothetical protein SAMN05444355_10687 [Flavobacterium frigoris]